MKSRLFGFAHAYRTLGLTSVTLAAMLSLVGCGGGSSQANGSTGKPTVVATIFAYYDAARAIGGDKIEAQILIPPNTSPHDYESTLEDKIRANRSQLLIINGLGIDERFSKLLESGSPTKVLNISEVVPPSMLLKNDEISLDAQAAPGATAPAPKENGESPINNPHIWLDPSVQMTAAEKIRDALISIDPADKDTFEANTRTYEDSLKKLDDEFKTRVPAFKTKDFIGFHSAYEYLARRYGLNQLASIEEFPGEGITPAQAQKVIKLIKDNHITYVAKETAFNEKGADSIVRETGVKLITLQPLETYENAQDTYVSLMEENLKSLSTALGN